MPTRRIPRPRRTGATLRAAIYTRQSRDKKTSIEDQDRLGRAACSREGWTVADVFSDGVSASQYGTKARTGHPLLLAAIERGEVDVLVVWEASRADRKLTTFSALLDLCAAKGVLLHALKRGRTYDPTDAQDWESLATDGVRAAAFSLSLSADIRRGMEGQAVRGRPHAQTLYGYQRLYDPLTREFAKQVPREDQAAIVREVVQRLADRESIRAIKRDLDERGVPTALNAPGWSFQAIRTMGTNKGYIGIRVHEAKDGTVTEYPAVWPALVDEAVWYAANRVLRDPARRTTPVRPRDGKAITLLGHIMVCGTCEDAPPVQVKMVGGRRSYTHCPAVQIEVADKFVTDVLLGYLSEPDTYALLRQATDADDRVVSAARAEVDRLSAELEDWRQGAEVGDVTRATMARVEPGLLARIAAAEAKSESASLPSILRGWAGPIEDVTARWKAASLGARRALVRGLLRITLYPQRGRSRAIEDRIHITGALSTVGGK